MVKKEKQNSMALHLVDMEGICSRHTGLSVDYKKPCTAGSSRLCHVCKNTAAWNGFFINVGLEVREGSCGALFLLGAGEGMTTANMATEEEKAQAATLLYWLLTQHRCVVKATITDDVFGGHEQVVCRALSDSVGKISALTLLQSSERTVVSNALVTTVRSMKQLVELNLMIDTPEQLAQLGPLLGTSSSLKVLRAVQVKTRLDGTKEFWEGIYKTTGLSSISLTTGILQALCGIRWPDLGYTGFARYLMNSRSLTSIKVIAPKHGPEVDVRTICQAVSYNSVLTQLDFELSTLKEEFAAPIGSFLRSTKTLKYFGLTYTCVDERYLRAIIPDPEHLSVLQSYCLRCGTIHVDQTNRIKPWIQALLQENDSLNELRFSLFGFCTLECRAFLNALSQNTTLSRVTIHRLGQNASEFCKFLTAAGVIDRVTTDIVFNVAYPNRMVAHGVGQLVNVSFCDLESTLHQVAACHRVTHVELRVTSFLYHSGIIEPAASPLIQLIRKAPALATLVMLVDSSGCSRCWNECAPFFCDSVLHNTAIINLTVKLPQHPLMTLLPLTDLLQRSHGLCRFTLEPPGPEAFREFVRELSKPKLEDNYNLAFVNLNRSEPDLVAERLIIQNVVDRNLSWATRAADFVVGYANKDTAEALEKMYSYPLLVEELCARQDIKKQQALDKIATKVRSMANLNEFMRLAGVVRDEIVCFDSVDGAKQLDDLNEYCLRHIRKYLKISDIIS
ncbi:uncharacterized protein LOC125939905 [Dermacentor silvarum]|uniref:uncharacterized protein LOC125939905 n=1 Tax=Dermacentor silvarum TaxID=543639 RepID=UPI0021019D5F|nr:uncharacterized protein LOC125939905 [Dermacentor silvarum]